jgi:hypothetical protein
MSDLLPGPGDLVAGRYLISRELGHGGMAVVYMARDEKHGREVALKVLRPELASAVGVERFIREIGIEATLQHPHILALYDSGEFQGLPYYVMPYVAGETLRDRLEREKQLSVDEALRLTREVAEALGYAHSLGVVHRDIKPANILLSEGHALVADFGIARALSVAGGEHLTATGLAIGTPAYMSPEQAGEPEAVDGRSDLYSLGCVLFEMLAGEPPFTGRTAQAILARHMGERPPSLMVVRPNLPETVVHAVERALAKVPADRFPTVADFIRALEAPAREGWRAPLVPALPRSLLGQALLAGAVALAAIGAWWTVERRAALDPNRVTVFPLRDGVAGGGGEGGASGAGSSGEDVASYLGFVLEGSDPLRWSEGRDGLTPDERRDPNRLTLKRMQGISRDRHAAHFIDGSIVRRPDSITVVLLLYDTRGGELIKRAGRSGPAASSEALLGALAVGDLLPALLEPGRKTDVAAWVDRHPAAIAQFIQGERAYRLTHWDEALAHYQSAVAADTAFAMAAIKGAQAATWLEREDEAAALLQISVRGEGLLSPRPAEFARGLRAYMAGAADSAVLEFRRALAAKPDWSEAWMALGEVYTHLLPRAANLDSLAERAFLEARAADSTFSPPLYHLTELALRAGDLRRGDRLLAEFAQARPDSTLQIQLTLMRDCIRNGPDHVAWRNVARRHPAEALQAGLSLSPGGLWAPCAGAAFRSVLQADSAAANDRWNALLGLQNLLVALGNSDSARVVLKAAIASGTPAAALLYLLDAVAGAGLDSEAAGTVSMMAGDYRKMGSLHLWYLGIWAARQGARGPLAAITAALANNAGASGGASDRLFADAIRARLALHEGDTVQALGLLRGLRPNGKRPQISWGFWEPLAGERMLEAEVLLKRGEFAEAERVAAGFDGHPSIYLLYLPPSLRLRIKAAEAERRPERAAAYRLRLSGLGGNPRQAEPSRSP